MGKASRSRSFNKERREKRQDSPNRTKEMIKQVAWFMLENFVILVHYLFDLFLDLVFEKIWGEKKVCPALKKDHFITKSAVELAQMIRNKELTSCQLVTAYIDRMKEVNPVINAVIDGPFMEAIEQAKTIDERIAKGVISENEFAEKPFLGVPFTTKDSNAVGGKLHTIGIVARKNTKAPEDAECIRLMKQAGAVIIATSSVPEINRWMETRNNIIGQTNNPYDIRRSVGGSSGGEGALITACASGFGIASDIGGSIRMPSYYCGLFGHKPTDNVINTKGCTFRTGAEKDSMVVAGPMVRSAKDLLPIMEVLVGPRNANVLKLSQKVQVQKLRYFYALENCDMRCSKVCGDITSSINKVTDHFERITGQPVQLVKLSGLEKSSKLWRYWMTQEPQMFSKLLGNGKELSPLVELTKKLCGMSEYSLAAVFSLVDSILPQEDAYKMKTITKALMQEIDELLGDDGILFFPPTTNIAPFHYQSFLQLYNFSYWSIFNVLHLPVTQVPLGLNPQALPVGVQVVATKFRDRHCIAVAEELEREFKGWVPPFTMDK